MIKGVLLDVDGTLALSNDAHAKAWVSAFRKGNLEVQYDKVRSLIGMGGDNLIPALFPQLNSKEGVGKEVSEYHDREFTDSFLPEIKPTPGAKELVLKLRETGKKVIIASSGKKDSIDTLLVKAGVKDLIDQYATSADVGNSKPDPDIIESALKKIDLDNDEAVMIGDSPYDIQAAHKSGVKVVIFRCGGFSDDDLKKADEIYNDPDDLLNNFSKSIISSSF